jgi:hypothetical protein
MRSNRGVETVTLITLCFVILAAFAIFWWVRNYSSQLGIFANANRDALNDNFNLMNTEVGRLLASQNKFAESDMALRLSTPSAIVGFNPGTTASYYSRKGSERRTINKPEIYCKTGACLCLYFNKDSWEKYEERHKNVWCQEYGDDTVFYSRRDSTDQNKGARLQLGSQVSGDSEYEYLVLYGEKFFTKAVYLEKQDIWGTAYVYIAELDPSDADARQERKA